MSGELTVEKLAEQVGGISLDRLIEQLNRAGVQVSAKTDLITDKDREKLLSSLKGEGNKEIDVAKSTRISLTRTSTSTLKVKTS